MEYEQPLSELSIAILGLGLMGGSLALTLHGKCKKLIGIDEDDRTVDKAREMNIFDGVFSSYPGDFSSVEVIILAVPVLTIIDIIWKIPSVHDGNAIIFDLGSTKSQITKAMQELPERFDPIGGHPMCGKEKSSIDNAVPDLFNGAVFVLSPLKRTTERARTIAGQIAQESGGVPLWLDAEINDRGTATTSHLPYLIAIALAGITPINYRDLAGPGFRSAARLSGSSIPMMMDILQTNRENILESLNVFIDQLKDISGLLDQNDVATLVEILKNGKKRYQELLRISDEQESTR